MDLCFHRRQNRFDCIRIQINGKIEFKWSTNDKILKEHIFFDQNEVHHINEIHILFRWTACTIESELNSVKFICLFDQKFVENKFYVCVFLLLLLFRLKYFVNSKEYTDQDSKKKSEKKKRKQRQRLGVSAVCCCIWFHFERKWHKENNIDDDDTSPKTKWNKWNDDKTQNSMYFDLSIRERTEPGQSTFIFSSFILNETDIIVMS